MRWGVLAIALTGCNSILGIAQTQPFDAPIDIGPGPSDEDGDGVRNDVDSCPGRYNPDQALDGDGDGVGDACDPHPTTPGDRIVAREMFSGPTYSWTPDIAMHWTLIDGRLQTGPVALGAIRRLMLSTQAPRPTIEMGFIVDVYSTNATNSIDVALTTSSSFMHTWIRGTGLGEPIYVADLMEAASHLISVNLTPNFIVAGSENLFIMSRAANSTNIELNGRTAVATIGIADPNISAVIEVREMQISITYLVLYASE